MCFDPGEISLGFKNSKGMWMASNMWYWTELPKLGGASGGLAGKVFKGIDTLTASDLLAREVIQNSWDASRKLNHGKSKSGKAPFKMEFQFLELSGKSKEEFLKVSGLAEIREESLSMKKVDADVAKESFDQIYSNEPLKLLICSDFGAHGLYGSIELGSDSILFRAIYMFGDTGKGEEEGTGGSYGFGKSAFIRGSGVATVFAYTSFAPFGDDKVTRRLVGSTYWNSHRNASNKDLEGRALYGNPGAGEPGIPFEDAEADALAVKLSFKKRTSGSPAELGTSLLLVHPQVDPEDLKESIEKWWWPALVDFDIDVRIIKSDGSVLYPRPATNNFVKPFLRAYDLATKKTNPSSAVQESLISANWQTVDGIELGSAALRVALEEELASEENEGGHFPKIALLRSPKMIIEYKEFERRRVAVRGVFVASDSADNHLKSTEPAQHSHWDRKKSKEIPEKSTAVADGVYSRLSGGLRKFIDEVSPPAPHERETLSIFAEMMRGLLTGKKSGPKTPPPHSKMPIVINFLEQPSPKAYKNQVFTESKIRICTGANATEDQYKIRITVDFQILEEESDSGEEWPCHVDLVGNVKGFEVISQNMIEGTLKKGVELEVIVKSDLYEPNWTSKLKPQVEIIEDESEKVKK